MNEQQVTEQQEETAADALAQARITAANAAGEAAEAARKAIEAAGGNR